MYGAPNRAGWERTQQFLTEMNRRTRASGARFLVASWPLLVSLDRYPFADVHEESPASAWPRGSRGTTSCPSCRGARRRASGFIRWTCIPNETAHRLAAESLVPAVLALR